MALHEDAGSLGCELFDLAAIQTIRTGGTVYTITQQHMPTLAPIAAILRY